MGNKASKVMESENPRYQELKRGYEGIRSRRAQLEELTKNEVMKELIAEGVGVVRSALRELEKHMDKDGLGKNGYKRRKHRRRNAGHQRRHGRHKYPDSGGLS